MHARRAQKHSEGYGSGSHGDRRAGLNRRAGVHHCAIVNCHADLGAFVYAGARANRDVYSIAQAKRDAPECNLHRPPKTQAHQYAGKADRYGEADRDGEADSHADSDRDAPSGLRSWTAERRANVVGHRAPSSTGSDGGKL
jgi:hypothetical protein